MENGHSGWAPSPEEMQMGNKQEVQSIDDTSNKEDDTFNPHGITYEQFLANRYRQDEGTDKRQPAPENPADTEIKS